VRRYRVAACAALLSAGIVGAVSAHSQFRPWDHADNPALLARNQRRWVELSVTPVDFTVDNSVVSPGDIFRETVVIDLPAITERVSDDGWRINAGGGVSGHGTLHVGPIGIGSYSRVWDLTRLTIPRNILEILSYGLERDEDGGPVTAEGKGEFVQRLFAESGLYASYSRNQLVYAMKLGAYVPLLYSRDASFRYDLYMHDQPNENGNYFEFNAGAEGELLLGVNPEGDQPEPAIGAKIDVGFIRQDDRRRAMYGAAVNSIPIVPAQVRYEVSEEMAFKAFMDSEEGFLALIDEEDGDDPFQIEEPDLEELEIKELAEPVRVFPETSVSGFYRFGLPVIDLIPHGEFVFGSLARLNAGLVVEGNLPVLNWLSAGFGYQDFSWQITGGLRIPLRVIELSTQLGLSAPELGNLFRAQGLTGRVSLAIGL